VFTVLTLPRSRNVIFINFSLNWRSLNTETHLTISHFNTSCHVHGYSMILDNLCRKERNVRVPQQMFINCIKLQYVDISFFSLSLYIHTRYDCDTKQTYSFWEDLMLQLSSFKSILNYAPNTVASYSFIFISWYCFSNCALWCAWFFFNFAVTSLGFK